MAGSDQWFINFTSGTVPGNLLTPKKYAMKVNAVVLEYLRQRITGDPVRLGIVVTDFPAEELIERIVESNFRT